MSRTMICDDAAEAVAGITTGQRFSSADSVWRACPPT